MKTRVRSCEGKVKRTKDDARRQAAWLRALSAGTSNVHAYKCRFCDGWHVGHRSPIRKPRRRR